MGASTRFDLLLLSFCVLKFLDVVRVCNFLIPSDYQETKLLFSIIQEKSFFPQ
jgi:hypothetical protein